jgi:outer membrane immunogenic protein
VATLSAAAALADGLVYGSPLDPPYYNWNGFYVGATAGGNFENTTAVDRLGTTGLPLNALGDTFSGTASDVTAAGGIGYNWHRSLLLLGIESDVGFLGDGATGTSKIANDTKFKGAGGVFTTLRARFGIVCNESLIYAAAGYFGADVEAHVFKPSGFVTSSPGFQSGWTVGAGWERMLTPNISLRFEYLHYDLGSDRVDGRFAGATQFFDLETNGDIARIGFHYRFGDRGEPVPPSPIAGPPIK